MSKSKTNSTKRSKFAGQDSVPLEEIKAQENRILDSPQFKASRQLSTFFRFVVEETLAGREDEIKAYNIAVQAFKRNASFDPQMDPFIRVLAGRLRRALEIFYYSDGANDRVLIEISKGSYVPVFRWRGKENIKQGAPAMPPDAPASKVQKSRVKEKYEHARSSKVNISRTLFYSAIIFVLVVAFIAIGWLLFSPGKITPRAQFSKPAIIILPLKNSSKNIERDFFVHSLAEDLSNRLSRFNDLAVISYYSSRSLYAKSEDIFAAARGLGIDYAVNGSVYESGNVLRIVIQLVDLKSSHQLWGETFERQITTANIFDLENEIVENIVGEIGGGYGVISRKLTLASLAKRETHLSVYEAIAIYRAFEYSMTPQLYQRAMASLEQAVQTDSQNALAWAMLGNLYFNAYTLGFAGIDSAYQEGVECIRKAIHLDPQDQFVRSMEGAMYQLSGNGDKALEALEKAIALNPNNGFMIGVFGWQMAMLGEFERGLEVMQRGMKLNPYYPGYFHLAYYLDYYRKGDYEKALAEVEKMNLPDLFWDPLLRTAALAQLGRISEARKAYNEVVRLRPDFPQRARFYIGCYIFPEDLFDKFLAGLNAVDKSL